MKLRGLGRFFKGILSPTYLLGFLLLASLLVMRVGDPLFIKTVRLQSFDFLQRLKPREYTKLPVAILDIDEVSLRKFGQWPWPRTRIAELIDKLRENGASTTGFDIIFSEPDRLSPARIAADNPDLPEDLRQQLKKMRDNESVMAEAMKKHRVVLGETSVRQGQDVDEEAEPLPEQGYSLIGEDPKPFLTKFYGLVRNMPQLEEFASGHGVFSVEPDPDGIYRRPPLVMLTGGNIRLALSAEVLRVATGGMGYAIKTSKAGIEGIIVARKLVPTDQSGKVWPYFTPSLRSRFISANDLLSGNADPTKIKGHMILVGTSAVGLEDFRATPLGVQMPGVEIHAQVIENILTNTMLKRPPTALVIELLAALLAGLAIIFIVPRLGAVNSFISGGMMVVLFSGVTLYAFWYHRTLFDPTFPIVAATANYILAATANYIREEQQKRQIRGAFGQYLSPALVDQLSDNPDRLVLGGETRELSVLFSDVRSFTTISESYKDYPQGLTRLMNRFLTTMSEPILDRNGTIDKYMGDAIMAFWNAPVDDENHAMNACTAGLVMIDQVRKLNEERKIELEDSDEEYHEISIGIGINSGSCVVGNMGSEMRFDYTALGDTVNLASRLEGQSKPYGLSIILGEPTANAVVDELALFEIDLIRVKGKNEPVRIFALVGDQELKQHEDFKAVRAMNATMITAYRNQDWKSAYEALELMENANERLDFDISTYLFIYETRISEFRANPPGASWDGVYTATSK